MLKLMYITNDVQIARIVEKNGIDRVWVDLETKGKKERQFGMNTVQSTHKITDVKKIKDCLSGKADLIVRINPIYEGTENEINEVIEYGADIIMLPYYKSIEDVGTFLDIVDKRAKTCLLLETIAAEKCLNDTLRLFSERIDEIHIGLNDLHLEYGLKFMFELLSNGKVEEIANKIKAYDIPYGFGGIAKLDEGLLPARHVIAEHYRLGSTMAIVSRSFYDSWISNDYIEIERTFKYGIGQIRDFERRLNFEDETFFENNRKTVINEVEQVINHI